MKQILRNSASPRNILGVSDHKIDLMLTHQSRKQLMHRLSTRPSHDIAEAKDSKRHYRPKYTLTARSVIGRRRSSIAEIRMTERMVATPLRYHAIRSAES